jgi:hypothetical protein
VTAQQNSATARCAKYPIAFLNASGGKVSASSSQFWRVVQILAALLALSLTGAVYSLEKPFICDCFINLATDKHGLIYAKFVETEGHKNPLYLPFGSIELCRVSSTIPGRHNPLNDCLCIMNAIHWVLVSAPAVIDRRDRTLAAAPNDF